MTFAVEPPPTVRVPQFSSNPILNGLYRRHVAWSNKIREIRNAVDIYMGRPPSFPDVKPVECRDPKELTLMLENSSKRADRVQAHIVKYKMKHGL